MSIVAIIQARMQSTRLPGKVMLQVAGGTILQTVCERVHAAMRVDRVVVATSMCKADTEIVKLCDNHGIAHFRGSEADVLDRIYQAAVTHAADYIVDITADCPLVDPRHIDHLIGDLLGEYDVRKAQQPDYVSNCWVRDWPDGLDIQCYTLGALAAVHGSKRAVREHVGWNIPKLAGTLGLHCRQAMAPNKYSHPEWGLTLDEPHDYELLKRLFSEMVLKHGNNLFPVESCLDWILDNPEVLAINKEVRRKVPGGGN